MKFTNEKYPFIKNLESGIPIRVAEGDNDFDKYFTPEVCKDIQLLFNYEFEYEYITKPFYAESRSSWTKLKDFIYDLPEKRACLFLNPPFGIYYGISYTEVNGLEKKKQLCIVMLRGSEIVAHAIWFMGDEVLVWKAHKELLTEIKDIGSIIMSCNLLMKFKETETKTIGDKKYRKKEIFDGIKYITEINLKVNIYDSRWYIGSNRDSPFGVRGHWRNQPCGPDRAERIPKFINGYVKYRYHRKPGKDL